MNEDHNDLHAGDIVEFIGATDEQVNFGNCDDPRAILSMGSKYKVREVEVHSWHTKITLAGFKGKFNSVHFKITRHEIN